MKLFEAINENVVSLLEADTSASFNAEDTIVRIIKTDVSKLKGNEKIIKENLKLNDPSVVKFAGQKQQLSKEWEDWSGKNGKDEPKTDIISTSKRISLKNGKGQLMSSAAVGMKNETIATLNAALEITGKKSALMKTLIKELQAKGQKLKVKGGSAEAAKAKNKQILNLQAFHSDMTTKFREFFDSNTDIYDAFVFEAMTGQKKFGSSNKACSNTLLIVGVKDPNNTKLIQLKSHKDEVVKKIRSKTSLTVNFKSAGKDADGFRSVNTAFRAATDESLLTSDLKDFMISEGLGDIISSAASSIKTFVLKLIELFKKGIKYVLEFFGITADIKLNNSIDFESL